VLDQVVLAHRTRSVGADQPADAGLAAGDQLPRRADLAAPDTVQAALQIAWRIGRGEQGCHHPRLENDGLSSRLRATAPVLTSGVPAARSGGVTGDSAEGAPGGDGPRERSVASLNSVSRLAADQRPTRLLTAETRSGRSPAASARSAARPGRASDPR